MNIYSDSSNSALKYLKNTEVNITNLLIMTGDFNIRDSIWDPLLWYESMDRLWTRVRVRTVVIISLQRT